MYAANLITYYSQGYSIDIGQEAEMADLSALTNPALEVRTDEQAIALLNLLEQQRINRSTRGAYQLTMARMMVANTIYHMLAPIGPSS
jgi:hypothetical protein